MSQKFNKKLYRKNQLFRFMEDNNRTIKYKRKTLRNGLINEEFEKRILLVVTEVNGCELCSYGHAKSALEDGISETEIHSMLSGSLENVPCQESVALFFAQHYADTSGKPTQESWTRLVNSYGIEKALGILGITRSIMIGNTIGIALGAFKSRLVAKAVSKSSLTYELGIILCVIPFYVFSNITVLLKQLLKRPLLQFE